MKRSLTYMPADRLDKIGERINKISEKSVKSPLRAAEKYLTPLALRTIVEYIIELEAKNG